jgi:AcrR family transcriptional regulator
MGKKRATNLEEKQDRRQHVLREALLLFERTPYAEIRMEDLAAQAGLAKGTLYLYFQTKEALFLSLLEETFQQWFAEINQGLAAMPNAPERGVKPVVRLIATSLAARPAFLRLLVLLHAILEQNSDLQTVLRFKRMLRDEIQRTAVQLQAALPGLSSEAAAQALLVIYALAAGTQQLADPAPVLRPMLQEPGLEVFTISFEDLFASALTAYFTGVLVQESN